MSAKVTYIIDGALIDVLRVIAEVKAITGMVPDRIYTEDGEILEYSDIIYHLLKSKNGNKL